MSGAICPKCCKSNQIVVIAAHTNATEATVFGEPVRFAPPDEMWAMAYCQRCDHVLSKPTLRKTASSNAAVIPIGAVRAIRTVSRLSEENTK